MIGARGRSFAVTINEPTRVGEARRRASLLAHDLGFDETAQGRVALVVSEAASNLIKHGGGGELVVQGHRSDRVESWLEILALDQGPGMSDVGRCLVDGYSTAGSLGTGLGAIVRLSDDHAIYSQPGEGTVVWARVDAKAQARPKDNGGPAIAAVSVPAPGELECGDDWATSRGNGRSLVMVVDGLGHGPPAAEAARAAVGVFLAQSDREPVEFIEAAHLALRSTRGAALAIARIDLVLGRLRYAGVGNISGVIVEAGHGRTTSMISHNGTVGHVVRKIQAFDYPWAPDSLLILHSDGITTRWDPARYPGLSRRPPGLIAGLLYRDHRRGRDDATVVVAREGSGPP
jgi:anti-sigma regulatory factor (Ser/Thr protein kinase)